MQMDDCDTVYYISDCKKHGELDLHFLKEIPMFAKLNALRLDFMLHFCANEIPINIQV